LSLAALNLRQLPYRNAFVQLIKTDEANVSNGALQLLKSDFYQRVQLQIQQMLNSSMAYLRLMLPVPADEPLQQRKHVRAFTPFFDALLAIREPAIAPSAAAVLNMYSPPPLRVFVKYLNYLDGTLFQASTVRSLLAFSSVYACFMARVV